MRSREHGQTTPLVAVVVLVAGLMALGLARMGGHALDLERAATAADAAALAGVAEGKVGAADVASRNGARLVSFTDLGTDVMVVVQVGQARAAARARTVPDGPSG